MPGNKTITDFIDSALMSLTSGERVTAGLWGEFIGNQIASTGATYNNAIKASFVNGESVSQAVARLRQATQGLLRREYETLTRTGIQHYAGQARRAMADDNLDILETDIHWLLLIIGLLAAASHYLPATLKAGRLMKAR